MAETNDPGMRHVRAGPRRRPSRSSVERGNFVKDLCGTHVNELLSGARKPRPGRRKGVAAACRGSPAAKPAKKTTAAAPKKRGRPRKTPAAS